MQRLEFGKEMREKAFGLDKPYFNHASYGLAPLYLLEKKYQYSKEIQQFPDKFFKSRIFENDLKSRQLICDLTKCENVDNLVLVNSATSGVNTVLRSYPFQKGDVIVYFSTIYDACHNTLLFMRDHVGVELILIDVKYPISDAEILRKFEQCVAEHGLSKDTSRNVMAFFDAIASRPGILFPWEQMVRACAKHKIMSFVDAAHWIGCKPTDLTANKPDFFVSNLHKWFFVPNSVAMLYVDPKHHTKISAFPVSATYIDAKGVKHFGFLKEPSPQNALAAQFTYRSTLDYTSYLTIPDAFEFRAKVCGGEEKIMDYILSCAQQGAKLMVDAWPGSEILGPVNGPVFNYRIPGYSVSDGYTEEQLTKICNDVMGFLMHEKDTFLPCFVYKGGIWSRWIAMVHLEPQDFVVGVSWVKEAFRSKAAHSKL